MKIISAENIRKITKKAIILFICCCGIIYTSTGNRRYCDSLETQLKTSDDIASLNIMLKLSDYYLNGNLNKSYYYAFEALRIAKQYDLIEQQIDATLAVGESKIYIGEWDYANIYYAKALDLAYQNDLKNKVAAVYFKMGLANSNRLNFETALEDLFIALKYYEELSDDDGLANAYREIGRQYQFWKDNKKALEFLEKSSFFAEKSNNIELLYLNQFTIAKIYFTNGDEKKGMDLLDKVINDATKSNHIISIANAYRNIGDYNLECKEYDKGMDSYMKIINILKDEDNRMIKGDVYTKISHLYYLLGDYEKELEYNKLALQEREIYGRKEYIISSLINIGIAYKNLKNYPECERYYLNALEQAKQLGHNLYLSRLYQKMLDFYSEMGDYKKAVEYYRLYDEVRNKVFSEEKTNEIKKIEFKYNLEKNEELISNKYYRVIFILSSFIFVIIIIVFIIYYRYKNKSALVAIQSHNQLLESEQRFRALFAFSRDGLILTDEEGKIIEFNKKCEKIFSISKEEILGQFIWDIHKQLMVNSQLNDDDLLSELQFQNFYKTGEALFLNHSNDFELVNFRGQKLIIQEYLYMLKTNNGYALTSIIRDITEKLISERDLKISEQRLAAIFDHSYDGILMTNEEGFIIRLNQSAESILLTHKENIIGRFVWEFLANFVYNNKQESFQKALEREYTEILETGTSSIINKLQEIDRLDDNNSEKVIQYVTFSTQTTNGYIIGILFRDTTKIKLAELDLIHAKEKAEELNKFKSILLSNLSHEIRTPLNGILGIADILQMEMLEEEQREFMKLIKKSAKRLHKTLESILHLSQVEANTIELNYEQIHLYSSISFMVDSYNETLKEKNLTFEFDVKDSKICAEMDESYFKQALDYLIDNAIKFTSQGGIKIEISSTYYEPNLWAYVKVIDTGIGIEKKMLERIFEEFYQADHRLERNYEGSGLGLTLAKKMIEIMGGKIFIESEPGIGTTVTIKFSGLYLT